MARSPRKANSGRLRAVGFLSNAEWHHESAVKQLADGLGLITWRPAEPLVTVEQRVLPTAVSDHLAVVADVRVRTP